MAYEAYTATVKDIAQKAFAEWRMGNDAHGLIDRLAKDWNVEAWHCKDQLTKLINEQHFNRLLTREDDRITWAQRHGNDSGFDPYAIYG
jgi:hypothetical protein